MVKLTTILKIGAIMRTIMYITTLVIGGLLIYSTSKLPDDVTITLPAKYGILFIYFLALIAVLAFTENRSYIDRDTLEMAREQELRDVELEEDLEG